MGWLRRLFGTKSDSTERAVRVNDDGAIHVKLYGLDTETTQADVQVATDASGRLKSSGTLVATVDNVEQYLLDQRLHFLYVGTLEDSGNTYVGYEDKDGNYYITKFDSDGDATYFTSTGGLPAKTVANWVTGKSYQQPASAF